MIRYFGDGKKRALGWLASVLLCIWVMDAAAQSASPAKDTNTTDFTLVHNLGKDLYRALKHDQQSALNPDPVVCVMDATPYVRPITYGAPSKTNGVVLISNGMIDLVQTIAQAKAIDSIKRGYFSRYMTSLRKQDGVIPQRNTINLNEKRFHTIDFVNEQKSCFNQIIGHLLAMNMAHLYLCHYASHSQQLDDLQRPPINGLLSDSEWNESVEAATRNALDCALGVDGLKYLLIALNKMPERPAWAAYFISDKIDVAQLTKRMQKTENAFFGGL